MFCDRNNIISFNLSQFDTSIVTDMNHMFFSCSALTSIDVSNFDTKSVKDMQNMFGKCFALKSLDLSHFNTSKVEQMDWMFEHCKSLTSLNINKFDVSKVQTMRGMFLNSPSIPYLNLSNFDTSNVITMKDLFSGCSSLTSLDLSNFDTSIVTNMENMFGSCISLTYLNIYNFDTSSLQSYSNIFSNINASLTYCINEEKGNRIIDQLKSFRRNKFVNDGFKCIKNCTEDNNNYHYEYKFQCYHSCPNGTGAPSKSFICEDINNNTCYETCKECFKGGNDSNHKCFTCLDNYFSVGDNCYQECKHYHYYDSRNQYQCTSEKNCPGNYSKLIKIKNQCIDNCSKDDNYKFEYDGECYQSCPPDTHNSSENYLCEDDIIDCDIDVLYINKKNNKCLKYCSGENFFNDICSLRLNDNAGKDEMILKIGNDIEAGLMDSLLENLTQGGGDDLVIEYKDISYQITSSSNQKYNENINKSSVILGECEDILRDTYGIDPSQSLIILKIDYSKEDS